MTRFSRLPRLCSRAFLRVLNAKTWCKSNFFEKALTRLRKNQPNNRRRQKAQSLTQPRKTDMRACHLLRESKNSQWITSSSHLLVICIVINVNGNSHGHGDKTSLGLYTFEVVYVCMDACMQRVDIGSAYHAETDTVDSNL